MPHRTVGTDLGMLSLLGILLAVLVTAAMTLDWVRHPEAVAG